MKVYKSTFLKNANNFFFLKMVHAYYKNQILKKSLKNIKITKNTIAQRVELSNMFFFF